ncbi:MAG: hypothetical protein D6702_12925 [Planctomycetota bacterium]|nr:MAG: hypothetical protein D6702_12925 [Planctomycetota bacterium]
MGAAWFLLFAVALASGAVGALSAAAEGWSESWFGSGDGWLFWLTWREDPGGRRLVLALAAAATWWIFASAAVRIQGLARIGRAARFLAERLGRPAPALAAAALALLPHLVVPLAGPNAAGRPSVVVVLLDSVRLDHVGWGGAKRPTTPRLDELAARGLVFRQAIAPAPWTKPAVASLLTGLTPGHHLAIGKPDQLGFAVLPPDRRTLAEALAREGWFTAAVSGNPNIAARFGFDQGFLRFFHDSSRRAPELIEIARRFLAEAGDRPFFLYLHLNDAHYPYEAPAPWRGRFAAGSAPPRLDGTSLNAFRLGRLDWDAKEAAALAAAYDEEILALDEQVGSFLEELLATEPNLIAVVLADHGEEFLDHGDLGHGHTLNDELLRVPLQLAWSGEPGLAAGEVAAQVGTLDLMPTLLELCGLRWPERARPLDGRSLLPVLRGEAEERPVFAETESPGSPRSGLTGPLRCWRRPEAKLIQTDPWRQKAGRIWLYDLAADPGETRNLAGARPELRRRLAAELAGSGFLQPLPRPAGPAPLLDPTVLAELAEMGYVDAPEALVEPVEPTFAAGAVPWWEEPD